MRKSLNDDVAYCILRLIRGVDLLGSVQGGSYLKIGMFKDPLANVDPGLQRRNLFDVNVTQVRCANGNVHILRWSRRSTTKFPHTGGAFT